MSNVQPNRSPTVSTHDSTTVSNILLYQNSEANHPVPLPRTRLLHIASFHQHAHSSTQPPPHSRGPRAGRHPRPCPSRAPTCALLILPVSSVYLPPRALNLFKLDFLESQELHCPKDRIYRHIHLLSTKSSQTAHLWVSRGPRFSRKSSLKTIPPWVTTQRKSWYGSKPSPTHTLSLTP